MSRYPYEDPYGRERRAPMISITDPYGGSLRASATPPPTASRRRIDGFRDRFGDIERPDRSHSDQRVHMDYVGPPTRYDARLREDRPVREPYGGERPPNPFRPGGSAYDDQFSRRRRDRDDDLSYEEERRRDSYRSGIGEPWGLAKYKHYDSWLRDERRAEREAENEAASRRQLRPLRGLAPRPSGR